MKMQLAARELELENKHIELLQMTKAEAAARASTASALEQVLRVHARMLAKNHIYCFCLRSICLLRLHRCMFVRTYVQYIYLRVYYVHVVVHLHAGGAIGKRVTAASERTRSRRHG
jgi:hypothetical protein